LAWRLLWDVLVKPGVVFARVVAEPRPATAILGLCGINLALTLITAPKLQAYALRTLEEAARTATVNNLSAAKTLFGVTAVVSAAATSVVAPLLWWLVLAGLLYAFGALLGRRVPFGTLYTVAAYAYPPVIAGNALQTGLILAYPVDKMAQITTSFAAFLPAGAKGPLYNFLFQVDPFGLWSLGLAAFGGAMALNTSLKRTAPFLFGIWLAYACVAAFVLMPMGAK